MFNPALDELRTNPEYQFFETLDAEVSEQKDIKNYLPRCEACSKFSGAEKFVRQLVKNYENYKVLSGDHSYHKYCRYFKYWLYKKRNANFSNPNTRLEEWGNCIFCVWNILEKENDKYNEKCKFDNKYFSYGFTQVQKALDEICSIKEKLKNDSEQNSDIEKCSNINKIKKHYLNLILSYIGTISSTSSWKKEYFKIDEDCSLDKIYNYLSEKQCLPKEVAQHVQTEQCKAPEQEKLLTCEIDTCNNLKDLCQQEYATQKTDNLDVLCQGHWTSKPPHDLKLLCSKNCAEQSNDPGPTNEEQSENISKFPHLQLPVTVFSSVVGTILFFLFLYKFTPFRSWFLNRIGSKKTLKHKIRQDMEQEFLAPFEPPYGVDQNSRPRVGYSQN